MLTAFTLKDFKSYREARLPLGPLTMIVGANASGKSNLIEALRLLSWMAQGHKLTTIQQALQGAEHVIRGRIADLTRDGRDAFKLGCETDDEEWNEFSTTVQRRNDELHISGESITSPHTQVPLYDLDQPSTGHGTDVGVAYNNFARGGRKPHVTCSDQMAILSQLDSAARFENGHEKAQREIPRVTRGYISALTDMLFLDPVPAGMRDYSFPNERRLRNDGANVSAALYAIRNPRTKEIPGLLPLIRSLPEQDISRIDFLNGPRGEVMLTVTETFGGNERTFDASMLSDGTLRVLAVAAAMLSAAEGGVVVIEEIDNGVHPSRAKHLLESINEIANRRNLRVLLSTHNPAMLDAVPDSVLPDVVFCYRDPDEGDSRLVRLQDLESYPRLVAQGPLGYLTTTGILDRFVKTPPVKTSGRAAAAWLKRLNEG